jgi:hypothetical protein
MPGGRFGFFLRNQLSIFFSDIHAAATFFHWPPAAVFITESSDASLATRVNTTLRDPPPSTLAPGCADASWCQQFKLPQLSIVRVSKAIESK